MSLDTRKPRRRKEPVVFIRIFMATTGVITVMSGLFVAMLTAWRMENPLPAPLPIPRAVIGVFTVTFLVGFVLKGVCWIMVAMSGRLWKTSS